MVLLGLVLRAAGVALLAATVLLPVADHHAATRLPAALGRSIPVAELVTHHHSRVAYAPAQAALALADDPSTPPTVLPNPSFWAEGAGAPSAALGPLATAGWLSPLGRVPTIRRAPPASTERAPPGPVPLLPA